MLTALDHIAIDVSVVTEALDSYEALGFTVMLDPEPDYLGREIGHAVFGDFFILFRQSGDSVAEQTRPGGVSEIVLRTDDIHEEVSRLRSHGIQVSDPVRRPDFPHRGSGSSLVAVVDWSFRVSLVERDPAQGTEEPELGDRGRHGNTVTVPERVYFAVESIERELPRFESLFGISAPEPELGTVIMSLMSVFYVGGIGIAVAEPRGAGPTAVALVENGPGLFQILFRAEHLNEAAALMVANGVRPPTRGTRLSGESALLVEPASACGIFVALAGQP